MRSIGLANNRGDDSSLENYWRDAFPVFKFSPGPGYFLNLLCKSLPQRANFIDRTKAFLNNKHVVEITARCKFCSEQSSRDQDKK